MTDYFETQNATVLSFPAHSGGKFLSNCLSLSQNCCPQDPDAAEYLLEFPDDYESRLRMVLKTLPPPDQMLRWTSFEYGDSQLYGRAYQSWLDGVVAEPNAITKKLCDSNMRFFIVDHSMEPINLCKVWKQATVIRLINFPKFRKLAWLKKQGSVPKKSVRIDSNYCIEKYNILRGQDWPTWEQFQRSGYDISKCNISDQKIIDEMSMYYQSQKIPNRVVIYDVDTNYFDKNNFLKSMENLYDDLGLTDFSFDLTEVFYDKYISLHLL